MFWKNSKPIYKSTLLGLATLGWANTALALSCIPMGPGDVYRIISDADVDYVVLEGQIDFDDNQLPKADQTRDQDTVMVPAWFSGLMLGTHSFDTKINGELQIEVHCTGDWCGTLESGGRYVLFARQKEDALVLPLDPCQSFVFTAADGTAGDVVMQCHRGGTCISELPKQMHGLPPIE